MNKILISLTGVTFAASGLVGCANMNETQRDTGMGAAIGAVAGGLIFMVLSSLYMWWEQPQKRLAGAVVLGKNRQDSLHASSVSCRPPCSSSRTDPTPTRRWTP